MKNIYTKLVLLACLFTGYVASAQMAGIDLTMYVTKTGHSEYGSSGGDCWESGDEEYTGKVWFWTDADGTNRGGSCRQCTNNGNCNNTGWGDGYTYYGTTATYMDARVYAWEDDSGNRCDNNSGDDCTTDRYVSQWQGATGRNFRYTSYPSNGSYYYYGNNPNEFGDDDNWAQVGLTWKYSGTVNAIYPSCTAQSTGYSAGGIRSWSVYLTAGVTYNFNTCASSSNDTYLRLFSPDGYTNLANADDNCGALSSMNYTAGTTGWHYLELSQYSRGELSAAGTLTYSIVPKTGATISNPIVAGTFGCGSSYSNTQNNTANTGFCNDFGQSSDDIYYQFTLSASNNTIVNVSHCGSGFDTYFYLLNSGGTNIGGYDDNGPLCGGSAASAQATLAPGVYYVVSEGYGGNAGNINTQISIPYPSGGSFATGTASVCNGTTGVAYGITGVSNATRYVWSVPSGASVASGQGTANITVNWGATGGNVTCTPYNGDCAGTAINYGVTVNPIPSNVTSFASAAICGTGAVTITANAGANGDQVQWSIDGSNVVETDGSSGSYTTASIGAGSSITVWARTRNNTTGCVGAWTSVTATANIIPSVVTSFANTAICGAGAVTVTANAGANGDQVQWSLNGSTVAETDGSSGSYTTTSLTAGTSITVWARTRNNTTGCFSAWTSVTAAANLIPSVVTSFANTAICGTGAVTITANAGANGDQVQWSLNGSTVAETDGSSGSYTTSSITAGSSITVYARTRNNTTGCFSAWTSVTATANHVPGNVTGLANQTRCGAGTVTFTAGAGTNGDQVQWSTDGSTVAETDGALGSFTSASILPANTTTVYSRTRNSTTGCTGAWTSATGTAYINPSNVTSFANTGICGTGGVTLTATAGVDGDQVQWSLDGSTVVETDGSSGSYTTPTVTAGSSISVYARTRNSTTGCFSGWVSVTATANVLPGTVTAFANQGRCGTGSVTFTATAGSNGDQVQWSNDGSTVAETDVSPGSFNSASITVGGSTTVYARTRNSTTGCFGSWTSATGSAYTAPVVTAPTVTQPLCDGNTGTIVVNGSGGFEYSINNGSTWQTSATFTGVAEGSSNNIVVRTNTSPACTTAYSSNPVNINNPTAIVIASVTPTNLSCNGSANGQIAVSASGGTGTLTYSSAGGGGPWGAQPFTGLAAGSYNIAVRDANNCVVSYVSNPVVLTQPATVTMLATPYISCPGVDGNTTIRLSASGGTGTISYRRTAPTTSAWTTNPQFSMPNGSTTYSFEARDANLCTQNAPLTFSALTNPTVLAPSTISCTPCSTQNENRDLYLANGTDIVTVINDNGNNVGLISGTVYVDGSSPLIDDGSGGNVATSPRHFAITFDSTNVANYVIIKFPIKNAELTTTETAAASSNSALDDLTSISTMGVTLWEGHFEDGTWGNGTKTYTQFIQQTSNGTDVLGNKYIEIRTGRNSEFWPHSSGNNTPLPIELLDFKAICQNDQVTINWSTAVEVNNDYFTIQRSADLNSYQDVAVVAGAGNSNTPRSYSIKDEYPLGGQSYYRLMQTDFDNQFKVFSPVAVVCVTKDSDVITVFPNPAVDKLNVSLNLSNADRGRIAIYNQFGQLVASEFVEPAKGFSTYTFDTAQLPAGQYYINFMFEGKALPTQKLIISR